MCWRSTTAAEASHPNNTKNTVAGRPPQSEARSRLSSSRSFSLKTLLLGPLLVSPLFYSVLLVMDEIARRSPRWHLGIFVYAGVYSLILSVAVPQLNSQKTNTRWFLSPFLRSVARGASFGLLFVLMLLTPWAFASIQAHIGRQGGWPTIGQATEFGLGFCFIAVTFVFIGATTGAVTGLFLVRKENPHIG